MLHFLRRDSSDGSPWGLGPLETAVMEVLWARGECSVRDVAETVGRSLAYTTVMTTLDRLFKKGLLDRRKAARAFLYSPCMSRAELERRSAADLMAGLAQGSRPVRDLLISCLLDSAASEDEAVLEELERKIRSRRLELRERRQP